MSDDPLDRIPGFDRVSVAAVLVSDAEGPDLRPVQSGITDPIVVEVRIGDGLDLSQEFFGDGVTPHLIAVLETEQESEIQGWEAPQGGEPDVAPGPARSVSPNAGRPQAVSTHPPSAFGIRPLAPVRRP